MRKTKEKIFMWYTTGAYRAEVCKGPFYDDHVKKIGRKGYHTLSELLKLDLEDSVRKNLIKARPGSKVFFLDYCSTGSLMLKCITKEKLKTLKKLDTLYKKITIKDSELKRAEKEYEKAEKSLITERDN